MTFRRVPCRSNTQRRFNSCYFTKTQQRQKWLRPEQLLLLHCQKPAPTVQLLLSTTHPPSLNHQHGSRVPRRSPPRPQSPEIDLTVVSLRKVKCYLAAFSLAMLLLGCGRNEPTQPVTTESSEERCDRIRSEWYMYKSMLKNNPQLASEESFQNLYKDAQTRYNEDCYP